MESVPPKYRDVRTTQDLSSAGGDEELGEYAGLL